MCDNIDEKIVNQELSDVLCQGTSQRFSKLVDRAASSTIQEMAWQSATQEVIENSSLKDENCHISENVSSAIQPIDELFLTNEKFQLQNVGSPLKHTQMPAKEVDNIFGNDNCCPGRIQKEETPYMSDDCLSVTNVEGNAQRHALSHTEQQYFNCGECGACFAEAGCLENHLRKHAQEGIHICDVCGAAFAQPNRLIYHKRNHTGEKPYKCDVCEASFAFSSNLTVHKRTHTGDKPYKCDVCEASFAHYKCRTVHKRTHTEKHISSESDPSVNMQVHSLMKICDNIDEKLVNQDPLDVLCEGTSQRFNKLVDKAACSTIQEMAWQSATQEVTESGFNSSIKDENCHISENVSLAIEPINELFLTDENFQLQNVGTPLKHTQMPPKEIDNIFDNDNCCPRRIQTEETPRMSDVCDSNVNVEGNAQRHVLSHTVQQAFNCGECGACFAEAGCLENHLRKHAQEGIHV